VHERSRTKRRVASAALIAVALAAAPLLPGLTGGPPDVRAADNPDFAIERLAGADRYATAAAISRATFQPGVPVAIVATGEDFPDGLAAGPAAHRLGGPVLFVRRSSVPASTLAELARLRPGRILVAGGTGVVSPSVLDALAPYTSGGVTRVAGPDRYATAAALSAASFPAGAPVHVATGELFPDALAAGAAAAAAGGPILLTRHDADGRRAVAPWAAPDRRRRRDGGGVGRCGGRAPRLRHRRPAGRGGPL
jgi:putative cell wall-binding protein